MKMSNWNVGGSNWKHEFENDLGLSFAKSLNKLSNWKQELNFLELEFKAEAEEIILKMDNFLVNNKLLSESLHCKGLQKKNKVLDKNLVGLKYEEMWTYKKESSCKVKSKEMNNNLENIESFQKKKIYEINSKELNQNILDTCEIVDKSVQTAKELSERCHFINFTSNKVNKSTHFDLKKGINNNKIEIDLGCDAKKNILIKNQNNLNYKLVNKIKSERNLSVEPIEDRRKSSISKPQLQIQELPTIHLKSGLQIQKVHNLEILPENTHSFLSKPSISIDVLSHEALVKKMELEEVKKSMGNFAAPQKNIVECFNCGSVVGLHWDYVNPREVDKILVKCNFNIFDPRIDEFVYKLIKSKESIKSCSKCNVIVEDTFTEKSKIQSKKKKKPKRAFCCKNRKKSYFNCNRGESNVKIPVLPISKSNLKQLTEILLKKYGEKVKCLEDHYWKLEGMLSELLSQVSKSKIILNVNDFKDFTEKIIDGTLNLQKPCNLNIVKVDKCDKKPFVFLKELNTVKIIPAVKKSDIRDKRIRTVKNPSKLKNSH